MVTVMTAPTIANPLDLAHVESVIDSISNAVNHNSIELHAAVTKLGTEIADNPTGGQRTEKRLLELELTVKAIKEQVDGLKKQLADRPQTEATW